MTVRIFGGSPAAYFFSSICLSASSARDSRFWYSWRYFSSMMARLFYNILWLVHNSELRRDRYSTLYLDYTALHGYLDTQPFEIIQQLLYNPALLHDRYRTSPPRQLCPMTFSLLCGLAIPEDGFSKFVHQA